MMKGVACSFLGPQQGRVAAALSELRDERVLERILNRDHTVWKPSPAGIADRLGWLDAPVTMAARRREIGEVTASLLAEGFKKALLLGMGGSSLAPAMFAGVFGTKRGHMELGVLDSTDPGAVAAAAAAHDGGETVFIVSSKSGGTVETLSFLRFFYHRALGDLGGAAPRRFLAVTDPGSGLAAEAERLGFRHCFLNDPDVGGRFSALTCFGLVPAALMGVDIDTLLRGGREALEAERLRIGEGSAGGAAAMVGAVLGTLAAEGIDKATFVCSEGLEGFGAWVEQLIAESTGKEGKGILPVVGEPLGPPGVYGRDRLFVRVRRRDDETGEEELRRLVAEGFPLLDVEVAGPGALGALLMVWELAVAVAAFFLGINPFDQPDVEAAKALARRFAASAVEGEMEPKPGYADGEMEITGGGYGREARDVIASFIGGARVGDYVSIQAYLPPNPQNDAALASLRRAVRDRWSLAVTVGYGPRYLHSTGQLHKGDAGRGLFIQVTEEKRQDLPIPDGTGLTFGRLEEAQARGDRQALRDARRRVLHVRLRRGVAAARTLARLADEIGNI
ncbi:MAG TPA: hypothetical protein PK836_08325 [Syntrophales bacterium]|nr:hypothetical protein [Syntrophales bacterium]HOM06499.1 hypothetical protein [Syntrophales bacterium]HON99884.1 hypothetical protein [Syntrophales bacterium]HPC01672.1 hypothetical protein [Syntrophales bacterium]HPQ06239.1 hypothetical protein [Syntrophales bacterium]